RVDNKTTSGFGGHAFVVYPGIPGGADSLTNTQRSQVQLWQVSPTRVVTELGPGHARHKEIRRHGHRAFSHWETPTGNDLVFPPPYAPAPRHTGNRYVLVYPTSPDADPLARSVPPGNGRLSAILPTANPYGKVIEITNPTTRTIGSLQIAINDTPFFQS